MSDTSAYSFDANLENFQDAVFRRCMDTPVVVDFWAPWCGPCQTLKPMLEKLCEEYQGRFLLAKVNSDENPELAQHFGVRSIPTVKVVFQGQLVDEFTGALPEGELRAFLDRIALPGQASLRDTAAALAAEGRFDEALASLVEATQQNPGDEAARLDAAELLFTMQRIDEARQLLALEYTVEADRAHGLRARLALTEGNADTAGFEASLRADENDHASRLALSKAYAAQGRYREALEAALEVVRRDRFFEEGAGRKAMLQIFEAIGGSEACDDLVREFRRRLSATLN